MKEIYERDTYICLFEHTTRKYQQKSLTSETPHIGIVVKSTIGRMNHQLKTYHALDQILGR
jgi:hypothetical protein